MKSLPTATPPQLTADGADSAPPRCIWCVIRVTLAHAQLLKQRACVFGVLFSFLVFARVGAGLAEFFPPWPEMNCVFS